MNETASRRCIYYLNPSVKINIDMKNNKFFLLLLFLFFLVSGFAQNKDYSKYDRYIENYWIHGFSDDVINHIHNYKDADIMNLLEMLYEPEYASYKHNIINIIGFAKNDIAVNPLLQLLHDMEEGKLELNLPLVKDVMYAFSLIADSGNRRIIDFLGKGADPNYWERDYPNISSLSGGELKTSIDLANYATYCLGFSGRMEALNLLKELKTIVPNFIRQYDSKNWLIDDAISTCQGVIKMGRSEYFASLRKASAYTFN